jgi:hypothetical protein
MRVNLITKSSRQPRSAPGTVPLSLTIRPACGLPGDYEFSTDSAAVLRMLHKQTDLPESVIRRFEENLFASPSAKLLGVELSERVLTEIGYFVE